MTTEHTPTGTEAAVCADIARRQELGIKKYGQTVAQNPLELRAWLQHAYEEALDQAIYLKRSIEEIDKMGRPCILNAEALEAAMKEEHSAYVIPRRVKMSPAFYSDPVPEHPPTTED